MQSLKKLAHRELHQALTKWNEVAKHQGEMYTKAHSFVMQVLHAQLAKAMQKWLEFAERQRDNHNKLVAAVAKMTGQLMLSMFEEWRGFAAWQLRMATCVHAVVDRQTETCDTTWVAIESSGDCGAAREG